MGGREGGGVTMYIVKCLYISIVRCVHTLVECNQGTQPAPTLLECINITNIFPVPYDKPPTSSHVHAPPPEVNQVTGNNIQNIRRGRLHW